MNAEKMQRRINAVLTLFVLFMVTAVVGEIVSSGTKAAKIGGFAAFGVLCILLRALPRKFLVPKPKR